MGFAGADSFTFAICDTVGFCDVATVTLEVPQPSVPLDACMVQVQRIADTSGQDDFLSPETQATRVMVIPTTLTTPLFDDTVAGSSLAVSAASGPGQGLTVSETIRVRVINGTADVSQDRRKPRL